MIKGYDGSLKPIPDPTELTTEALKTSIANLKELLEAKIYANKQSFEAGINNTNTLKEVKFQELKVRLDLIERQRTELKEDAKDNIKFALESQKQLLQQQQKCSEEAVEKAEKSFTRQIDAVAAETKLSREGLSDRINGLKERIDRGTGREDKTVEFRGNSQWFIGLIIIGGISLVGIILTIIQMLKIHP